MFISPITIASQSQALLSTLLPPQPIPECIQPSPPPGYQGLLAMQLDLHPDRSRFHYPKLRITFEDLKNYLSHHLNAHVYAIGDSAVQAMGGSISGHWQLLVTGPESYPDWGDFEQRLNEVTRNYILEKLPQTMDPEARYPVNLVPAYRLKMDSTELGWDYEFGPQLAVHFARSAKPIVPGWQVSVCDGSFRRTAQNGRTIDAQNMNATLAHIQTRQDVQPETQANYLSMIDALNQGATISVDSQAWIAFPCHLAVEDPQNFANSWIAFQRHSAPRAQWISFLNLLLTVQRYPALCQKAAAMWLHTRTRLNMTMQSKLVECIHQHPDLTPLILAYFHGKLLHHWALANENDPNRPVLFNLPFNTSARHPRPYAALRCGVVETRHVGLADNTEHGTPVDIAGRYFVALEELPKLLNNHGLDLSILNAGLRLLSLPSDELRLDRQMAMEGLLGAFKSPRMQGILTRNYEPSTADPKTLIPYLESKMGRTPFLKRERLFYQLQANLNIATLLRNGPLAVLIATVATVLVKANDLDVEPFNTLEESINATHDKSQLVSAVPKLPQVLKIVWETTPSEANRATVDRIMENLKASHAEAIKRTQPNKKNKPKSKSAPTIPAAVAPPATPVAIPAPSPVVPKPKLQEKLWKLSADLNVKNQPEETLSQTFQETVWHELCEGLSEDELDSCRNALMTIVNGLAPNHDFAQKIFAWGMKKGLLTASEQDQQHWRHARRELAMPCIADTVQAHSEALNLAINYRIRQFNSPFKPNPDALTGALLTLAFKDNSVANSLVISILNELWGRSESKREWQVLCATLLAHPKVSNELISALLKLCLEQCDSRQPNSYTYIIKSICDCLTDPNRSDLITRDEILKTVVQKHGLVEKSRQKQRKIMLLTWPKPIETKESEALVVEDPYQALIARNPDDVQEYRRAAKELSDKQTHLTSEQQKVYVTLLLRSMNMPELMTAIKLILANCNGIDADVLGRFLDTITYVSHHSWDEEAATLIRQFLTQQFRAGLIESKMLLAFLSQLEPSLIEEVVELLFQEDTFRRLDADTQFNILADRADTLLKDGDWKAVNDLNTKVKVRLESTVYERFLGKIADAARNKIKMTISTPKDDANIARAVQTLNDAFPLFCQVDRVQLEKIIIWIFKIFSTMFVFKNSHLPMVTLYANCINNGLISWKDQAYCEVILKAIYSFPHDVPAQQIEAWSKPLINDYMTAQDLEKASHATIRLYQSLVVKAMGSLPINETSIRALHKELQTDWQATANQYCKLRRPDAVIDDGLALVQCMLFLPLCTQALFASARTPAWESHPNPEDLVKATNSLHYPEFFTLEEPFRRNLFHLARKLGAHLVMTYSADNGIDPNMPKRWVETIVPLFTPSVYHILQQIESVLKTVVKAVDELTFKQDVTQLLRFLTHIDAVTSVACKLWKDTPALSSYNRHLELFKKQVGRYLKQFNSLTAQEHKKPQRKK